MDRSRWMVNGDWSVVEGGRTNAKALIRGLMPNPAFAQRWDASRIFVCHRLSHLALFDTVHSTGDVLFGGTDIRPSYSEVEGWSRDGASMFQAATGGALVETTSDQSAIQMGGDSSKQLWIVLIFE